MRLIKWVALPMLSTAALATLCSFAGCSVTSGTVDTNEGGTTSPTPPPPPAPPPAPPSTDGGATCADNNETQKTKDDNGVDCQACLDQNCCNEMKGCFNAVPGQTDAGTTGVDCNTYAQCVSACNAGDAGDLQTCYTECDTATTQNIIDAYGDSNNANTYVGCAAAKCKSSCSTL